MAAPTPKMITFLASLTERRVVAPAIITILAAAQQGNASYQDVDKAIKDAKAAPWKEAQANTPPAEPGYYHHDGTPYVVVASRESGKPYAKRLTSGGWEYAAGMVWKLKPEHRMTVEQAQEYGKLHGVCAVCGRTLTDEKSVGQGIGPVCAKKLGGMR